IGDVVDDIELLGATIDDAAGEAFDKTARLLGLNCPGGPNISKAALGLLDGTGVPGDRTAVKFPRGLAKKQDLRDPERRYNFSFSGLKTAALREVTKAETLGTELRVADIAAGFEDAVVDVLVAKTLLAAADTGIDRVVLGGGVAANTHLREVLAGRGAEAGVTRRVPPLRLCTDNGAMVAALGAELVSRGIGPSDLSFAAVSSLDVDHVLVCERRDPGRPRGCERCSEAELAQFAGPRCARCVEPRRERLGGTECARGEGERGPRGGECRGAELSGREVDATAGRSAASALRGRVDVRIRREEALGLGRSCGAHARRSRARGAHAAPCAVVGRGRDLGIPRRCP